MEIPTSLNPFWRIPGTVVECRELKTKKDNSVWAYSVKIMGMGGVYDLQTRDPSLFAQAGEGMTVVAEGRFEQFNGGIKLIVTALGSEAAKTTK